MYILRYGRVNLTRMENLSFTFDPRLDTDFLASIYEDDTEHAMIVFDQFLNMAPALMKEIDEGYTSGTIEAFRQKVHKLKPVFSFVGLTHLTGKAEVLERRCRETSEIKDLGYLYEELKHNFSQSFPIIENEVKRLKEQIS